MRIDKKRNLRTLEEDIIEIWKLHGLNVVEEKVKGNTWIISAEEIKQKMCRN